MASSNPELGEYKESVGSCPSILHVSFGRAPRFSLVIDLELDWEGRLGVLMRNLRTPAYLLVLPGSRARIVRCGGRYDPQLVKRSSECE